METLDFAIIASKQDSAGMNIAKQLQLLHKFPATMGDKKVGLFLREEFVTESDGLDREIAADVFVFASRHVSRAGVHSLSVHSIGNWGEPVGGGKAGYLVPAPALLMKNCFNLLRKKVNEETMDYEVILEATHHGPCMEKPAMFIEIGSDEKRYSDERAGKVIATTVIDAIRNCGKSSEMMKPYVGIGGLHHCPNFAKAMLSSDAAISYVCPKHLLGNLDEAMLRQAMEKSLPESKGVVIDWKGLGTEKGRIIEMLDKAGVEARRTKEF